MDMTYRLHRVILLVVTAASGSAGFAADVSATRPATGPTSRPASEELRPILTPEARLQVARERIDRFVDHVNRSPAFAASARRAVTQAWQKHRADDNPRDFLLAGLAMLSEPFKNGFEALEDERYDRADQAFGSLLEAKDPYLSRHAQALLARSLVEQDRLEEAQLLLAPLAADEAELIDKTFLEAEVDFLLGYCQLANLHYDEALTTLETFERQHPDAPETFRLPATQMLQEMRARRPESLGEVSDLMVYAGRRLRHGQPGKPVQIKQTRAVELLDKLIEETEEREKQQSSGGGGGKKQRSGRQPGNPKNNPQSPMQESMLPDGTSRVGDLHRAPRARPGEEWGKMRPEERDRILQGLRLHFPSRYRRLVEQYYKQLAKER